MNIKTYNIISNFEYILRFSIAIVKFKCKVLSKNNKINLFLFEEDSV